MERDLSWFDSEIIKVLWIYKNALDGTEDDAVWDDKEEGAEEAVDNEFETDSKAENNE